LRYLIIPSTVTVVEDWAFDGCSSLGGVHVQSRRLRLGKGAIPFDEIIVVYNDIPSTVTYAEGGGFCLHVDPSVNEVPERAFLNHCLIEVELPQGLLAIGNKSFCRCASLRAIHLFEGLLTIGENAFAECTSLKRIAVPSTVTVICDGAFHSCTSIEEVNLREGLIVIGHRGEDGVRSGTRGVFSGCTSLLSITIPSTVTNIGAMAFGGCTSLETVHLSDGIQAIEDSTFFRCTSLKCILIPSSVTLIGDGAFDECTNLEDVQLCEGLLTIGDSAFRQASNLLRITIPSTVTSIEGRAFHLCRSLKEVHLFEGLRTIGECAFASCGLSRITIPATVSYFGEFAFGGCKTLIGVHLCEGIHSLGEYAFDGCHSLLRINLPSTLLDVGDFDCTLLRNVAIARSITLEQGIFGASFREVNCTLDMLRSRFDDLPVHEVCFFHSHPAMNTTNQGELLQNNLRQLATQSSIIDCLGMTPLHVLACSAHHDLRLYQCISEIYPDAIITRDIWGETPLEYVLLSEAPTEILHFCLETWKRSSVLPFDLSTMISRLDDVCKSGDYVRQVIQAQRTYFPGLDINWREMLNARTFSLRIYGVIVEASFSNQYNCMSTEQRREIDHFLESETFVRGHREFRYGELRRMITQFIQEHREFLIIASTMLELALWKSVLNESLPQHQYTNNDRMIREEIRVNGGQLFQVVIPHVLSFL